MTDKQGKRHSDCDDLVEVLYEYVDGGCDERLRARLAVHVNNCPSCLEQLGIEQQVRQLLRARCCDAAPEELRGRIVSALRTTTVRQSVTPVEAGEGRRAGEGAEITETTEITEVTSVTELTELSDGTEVTSFSARATEVRVQGS